MNERTAFFDAVRRSLFAGKLTGLQVKGMESILDACGIRTLPDRWTAYILATAFHETGGRMQPVTENLNYSEKGLLRTFPRRFRPGEEKLYARKPEKIANRVYARRMGNGDEASGDGWLYRGRGLVQITGRKNYKSFGLERDPDRALLPDVAVRVLINGMVSGAFSGKRLYDCFRPGIEDWEGARAIINGSDRAGQVARYGQAFLAAMG